MPDRSPSTPSFRFLERLGLPTSCTPEQVREAYLHQARRAHPDHGGDKRSFQQLKSDYEQALQYAERIHRSAPGRPHDATLKVRAAEQARRSPLPMALLGAACCAFVTCFLVPSGAWLALSLGILAVLTVALVQIGIPRLPRPHATILCVTLIAGTGLLLLGLTLQGLYQDVLQIQSADRSAYDWLILASPIYFVVLWALSVRSWTRSFRN